MAPALVLVPVAAPSVPGDVAYVDHVAEAVARLPEQFRGAEDD
jgi:hypothetical protein